ncbi:kynureninase [Sugiyamaella lignohabitans]|uniref:Kynureninase n=1 Tax=Sugiyamaella lignohabitans TaxID=796027 RepID=A0A167EH98_9ASCO|nr:kynureninase [Sugiyamaella lignohabitans]ANB14083.1 kynureninase [Sugiyamaella lignohabitans]
MYSCHDSLTSNRAVVMSNNEDSVQYAKQLDAEFPSYKEHFAIPTLGSLGSNITGISSSDDKSSDPSYYFCGNSLGLMPLSTEKAVLQEIDAWKQRGVVSHFDHPHAEPWVSIDDPVTPLLAPLVGSEQYPSEVAIMNTLTGNLHTMLSTFYRPEGKRYKILFEQKAFPSDTYAFQGQVQLHGYSIEDGLIPLAPREGEYTLRTEDILAEIERSGDSIAVIIFSGIQFYTGQLFDMKTITQAGKSKGCIVGWDLAHAIGNVPMKLHDWGVDFAVFCTYKYLNSGPGSIGGIFVHSKHSDDKRPRLAGWWGNNSSTRFQMLDDFDPISGAYGFRMSNPSVLNTVCLGESLKLFKKAGGIEYLRKRSLSMTNYLYDLLIKSKFYVDPEVVASGKVPSPSFTIITPKNPEERGAQLSLLFLPINSGNMQKVFSYFESRGVIGDERKPDVLRLAPNHFYNTHQEVLAVTEMLDAALDSI